MPLSNAERQRRYRERAYRDPDGHLLARITLSLAPRPAAALKRLASGYGITQRELIERLLSNAERSVMARLDPDQGTAYLDGKLPAGALQHNETGEPLRDNDDAPASLQDNEPLRDNNAESDPLPHNAETPETLPSNEATDQPLPSNAPFNPAPAAPTEPLSARDAEILALHAAGVPLRQIARQFGYRSDNSIRHILKQHSA